jgi:hypothetical protein
MNAMVLPSLTNWPWKLSINPPWPILNNTHKSCKENKTFLMLLECI